MRRRLSPRPRVRVAALVTTTSLVASFLVGCQANPGDAPTVEDEPQPTAESTQPTAPPSADMLQLTVGVDTFSGNLNPHLVGNVNPVITAIADLTLPSAFTLEGEQWVPNRALLNDVTPDNEDAPRTVTYVLNSSAQWSDGTPVSVSDFQYLRDKIVAEAGTSETASYEQIESIKAGPGNSVKVTFAQPFAGWRELFRYLLPSHIYKSEDRPFSTMMDGSLAASAGAFNVAVVDADRGRVELRRNDRFWGERPAAMDKLILDVVPNLATSAQMLRTGQMDMLMTSPDAVSELALGEVPNVSSRVVQRQVDLSVVLNTASARVADQRLRGRILAALDRESIAKVVSGRPDATSPQEPPFAGRSAGVGAGTGEESAQESNGADAQAAESTAAQAPTGAQGDGSQELIVAAPTDDARAVNASRMVVDQLLSAGIPARSVTKTAAELYSTDVPEGSVDAVVSWQKTPTTVGDWLNQFHCVLGASSSQEEAGSERAGGVEKRTNGNLSGLCDAELADTLKAMASGNRDFDEAKDTLTGRIAEANVMLPLLRDEQIVAIGPNIDGPARTLREWATDPLSGIMITAPTWKKKESSQPVQPIEEAQ